MSMIVVKCPLCEGYGKGGPQHNLELDRCDRCDGVGTLTLNDVFNPLPYIYPNYPTMYPAYDPPYPYRITTTASTRAHEESS